MTSLKPDYDRTFRQQNGCKLVLSKDLEMRAQVSSILTVSVAQKWASCFTFSPPNYMYVRIRCKVAVKY